MLPRNMSFPKHKEAGFSQCDKAVLEYSWQKNHTFRASDEQTEQTLGNCWND